MPGSLTSIDPSIVPLRLGITGLAQLWDRRAAAAPSGAAEAYQRAAAELSAVVQTLAPGLPAAAPAPDVAQEELPL